MSEFKKGDKVRIKADCEKYLNAECGAELYVTPRVAGAVGEVTAVAPFTARLGVLFEDLGISQLIPQGWLELVPERQFKAGDQVIVTTERAFYFEGPEELCYADCDTDGEGRHFIPVNRGTWGVVVNGEPDDDGDIAVDFATPLLGGGQRTTRKAVSPECLALLGEKSDEESEPIYFSDGGVWLGDLSSCAIYVAPEDTPMPTPGVPIPPEWKPVGRLDPDEIKVVGDDSAECKLKDFPMGLGLPAVGEIKFEVPVDLPGELKETLDYQQAESDFQWGIEELMKHGATCTEDIFLKDVRDTLFDRGEDYGGIEDNFADIAQMWGPIFGVEIRPDQVALAMIALKLVRANNGYKRDNAIDIAGYAVHLAAIQERQGR